MDLGWWETKALARIDIWSVSQVMSFAWRLMSPTLNRCYFWLVVDLPLWKIWVRQLGWWNSQSMEKLKIKNVPNHQAVLPFQAAWHPWFFTPKKLGLMDVYPALKFDVFKRFWPHTHHTPRSLCSIPLILLVIFPNGSKKKSINRYEPWIMGKYFHTLL